MDNDRIEHVAETLYIKMYEARFRGKDRGRFCLTREQLREALGVKRLHAATVARLQDAALEEGLVIIDMDDLFPCIETEVLRKLRRPPAHVFEKFFPESDDEDSDTTLEDGHDE